MAAPSSAFHTVSLKKKSGASLIESAQMAKYLEEYGSVSNIKAIFKIDLLQKLTDENTSMPYFIGMVDPAGSNAVYHNSSRVTNLKRGSYAMLNDAGLNTKPAAAIGNMANEPKWENWINIPLTINPAYYLSSTQYGYLYKINSGSWNSVSVGTLSTTNEFTTPIVHVDLSASISAGDTLYLKIYATNDEGTIYSGEVSFTIAEPISVVGGNYIDATDPQEEVGAGVYLYMTSSDEEDISDITTSDASSGIMVYESEYFNSSNYVDNGYYLISGYSDKAYLITSGEIRKYVLRVTYATQMNLYVINKALEGLPEFYIIAGAVDGVFPNTLTVYTETRFYTYSGGTYTETGSPYNSSINLTQGSSYSEVYRPLLSPPSGATHSRTTTSTSGIGMSVTSPYQAL